MQQVDPLVYRLFAGWTGNQYLIVEPEGLTLVDCGLPGSHRLILRRILELGRKPADLTRILITHSDPDHCGAAAAIRALTGAQIFASSMAGDAMAQGKMTRPLNRRSLEGKIFTWLLPVFHIPPTMVDFTLQPGDEIQVLGGLRVIASEGHAPGHVSFFSASTRILFAGDSIRCYPTPQPYQNDTTVDHAAARESFLAQMQLAPRLICAGHGFAQLEID